MKEKIIIFIIVSLLIIKYPDKAGLSITILLVLFVISLLEDSMTKASYKYKKTK